VVNALDFGSGGRWFEFKLSYEINLGLLSGDKIICDKELGRLNTIETSLNVGSNFSGKPIR
jgi:hypothetical protein